MVEKCSSSAQKDPQVNVTLNGFSQNLLREFALRIVKPYFKCDMNEAIKNLMEKAIIEEELANKALRTKKH
jgi:hypothetical protein